MPGVMLPVVGPCPFCSIPASRIWIESEHAIAFAPDAPAAEGHIVVVPKEHVPTIHALPIAAQNTFCFLSSARVVQVRAVPTQLEFRLGGRSRIEAQTSWSCASVSPACVVWYFGQGIMTETHGHIQAHRYRSENSTMFAPYRASDRWASNPLFSIHR
jgi:hypothetical protein